MRGFGALDGLSGREVRQLLVQRLRDGRHRDGEASGVWLSHFRSAFEAPDASAVEVIDFHNVSRALAAYQESQQFTNTPWRRYLAGDLEAMDDTAKRGALLFHAGPRDGGAGCARCHAGHFFTDERFHNLALPQFGRGKGKRGSDFGRELINRRLADRYAFRTPSLLNVEMTAPYGHTGAYPDLAGIIRHHLDPAAAVSRYDYSLRDLPGFEAGALDAELARRNTRAALAAMTAVQAPAALSLEDAEVEALVAFLQALTDPCTRSAACLARWIPTASEDPDGFQLDAVIAAEVLAAAGVAAAPRLRFTDVTAAAGLTHRHVVPLLANDLLNNANQALRMAGGVAAGDYDGDGWVDLYMVTGAASPSSNRLYRNAGDGSFVDVTEAAGVASGGNASGPIFADFDGDGHLDLFVGGVHVIEALARTAGRLQLERLAPTWPHWFRNRGDGTFEDVTDTIGVEVSRNTFSATFADVDRDADVDVFLTHWDVVAESEQAHLWFNDGSGHFTAAGPEAGFTGLFLPKAFTFTANFADIDGDGWPDLLLAADYLTSRVFRNLGGGRFEETTDPTVIADENGMGAAVGDYDNDGDLDWFVTSVWDATGKGPRYGGWGSSGNRLYRNRGDGSFEDATESAGVRRGDWGWGSCFADFDNDGDLDIFHVNGYGDDRVALWKERVGHLEHTPAKLFVNVGGGRFEERAASAGIADTGQGRGVVCFDVDRDGDLDVLIANSAGPPALYRNELRDGGGAAARYLQVRLRGTPGNREGLGARVEIETASGRQVREIRNANNFVSQNPAVAHFGLGVDDRVHVLRVTWPELDGPVTELTDVAADHLLTVVHPDAD